MAVAKSRKSSSRTKMKRAQKMLVKGGEISTDSYTGENHRRHHVTKGGFYKGKQVIKVSEKD